ncbi:unnamed protein product [Rhizoctonia solani]|uniref:Uncharacterized protein n=1 Tax=Rhizoctonia solani TaxID=456999 RepID=A0A8H3GDK5_9AGAM|nr:unnamed protein product [Rhizoctonia solani]
MPNNSLSNTQIPMSTIQHKQEPHTELVHSPLSASSSSGSSSGKSIRRGENDSDKKGRVFPGHCSAPSKASIVAADLAMKDILKQLVTRVRNFKCPSELEFSLDGGSPMMLPNVEKNESFIDQLRKLQSLTNKLDEIPTHGDAQLKDLHDKVGKSIEAALLRMKEVQLKLYVTFLNSAYNDLADKIRNCHKNFVCPRELDFPENSKGGLVLSNTKRNKPFIDHLLTLGSFREQLGNIPEYDNEQLNDKREAIGQAIGGILHGMKTRQLELYNRQNTKARPFIRPCPKL